MIFLPRSVSSADNSKEFLDSLYHCQTSQIHVSRKLLFSSLQFFIVPNTVTSVVDWFRLVLIPEMAVNTRHPGDFLASPTEKYTCLKYPS